MSLEETTTMVYLLLVVVVISLSATTCALLSSCAGDSRKKKRKKRKGRRSKKRKGKSKSKREKSSRTSKGASGSGSSGGWCQRDGTGEQLINSLSSASSHRKQASGKSAVKVQAAAPLPTEKRKRDASGVELAIAGLPGPKSKDEIFREQHIRDGLLMAPMRDPKYKTINDVLSDDEYGVYTDPTQEDSKDNSVTPPDCT